jgi:hypothetical protein
MPRPARTKKIKTKSKRGFRKISIFVAVVALTWGVWTIFDHMLNFENNPYLGPVVAIVAAFLILFLDDFHLRELE